MECDSCGHPVQDPQQDQQLMEYDRTYSQAVNHLIAGNWEETIGLLNPLLNRYPTEKKLYLTILRAATHDFSDINMENPSSKSVASGAWDKLVRLHGVNGEMIRYGRQRYEKHREELYMQRSRVLRWIIIAAILSVFAGLLFGSEHYILALFSVGGMIGSLRKVFGFRPVQVVRQLTSAVPDYRVNPFI